MAVLPGTYIELCIPMAVAERDEDAESSPWTEEAADDGDGDWELAAPFPKLLAMYRWSELFRFGMGILLRRGGDVDSGGPWDTSIVAVIKERSGTLGSATAVMVMVVLGLTSNFRPELRFNPPKKGASDGLIPTSPRSDDSLSSTTVCVFFCFDQLPFQQLLRVILR